MKRSRRSYLSRASIVTLLVLVSLLVVACPGGQAEPTPAPAPAEPAPAEPAPDAPTEEPAAEEPAPAEPATGEQVTVTVAGGAVGQERQLTLAGVEAYMEQNPNVNVRVVEVPEGAGERLGVYLQDFERQAGEYDVLQIDVIWPGDLAEHLVDLNQYADPAVIEQHFPAIIENNTVNGQLLGIPWFTDAGLLYYRTDLLEEYGYDSPPATWQELEEMARTITEGERADNPDLVGFVWQANAYEGLTCTGLELIASHGGGTIVSPDGVITINNPNAVRALELARSWVGTISPNGVTGFQEEDARNVWHAGNAVFMRNWPYAYSLSQDSEAVAGNFGVSPLPVGEGGEQGAACLGGWQLAVSRYSAHPDVAADVALFLASPEQQKMRAIEGSLNPTVQSLYEDPEVLEASPFFGDLYDVFINATPRPSTATAPNYNQVSTIFFSNLHSVLTGGQSAQDAVEEMELELEDLTGFETGAP
jgi:trehalose/maltose transport system substrate-binding protein